MSVQVKTKVYVGNLPETVRKEELTDLFTSYGTLAECDIVRNYAFVHFDNEDDAKRAVGDLHGSEFHGQKIKVELSVSRVRQKPGMGGKNECYRCGGGGHWSKDCPTNRGGEGRGRGRGGGPGRGGRGGGYGGRDSYYERSRPSPYGDPYSRGGRDRDPYMDRSLDRMLDHYRPYDDPYVRRRAETLLAELERLRDPYYDRPPPDYYDTARPARDPLSRDPYMDRLRDTLRDPYRLSLAGRGRASLAGAGRGRDPYSTAGLTEGAGAESSAADAYGGDTAGF